jgi:hypothetical protein
MSIAIRGRRVIGGINALVVGGGLRAIRKRISEIFFKQR